MTDGENLRKLAQWFDAPSVRKRFPEWSDSDEVQRDLRRIAGEIERLRAIVDKLPKTADGVPLVPGMEVWDLTAPPQGPLSTPVRIVTVFSNEWYEHRYSTRKAAESAGKDGKGELDSKTNN